MKRKLIAILMIATMLLASTACSAEEKKEEHFADKDFIVDLQKGLQERWDITDNTPYTTDEETKKVLSSALDAELNAVKDYQNQKFEDSKLQELVLQYINSVKAQDESLDYISADAEKFNEMWQTAYETRTQLIETFYKDYDLKVDKKYQDNLDELLTKSKLVTEEANTKKTVEDWFKTFNFTQVSDDYGFKTYEAVVENNTGVNFDYVNLSINLIDENGVTVETTYSNFNNISAGAKVKFEFSTDKDFVSTEITGDYMIKE
ncbi:MAG: FxLYD domain-containing protein [[Clostridium] scindens]